jgi:hypothetical protein
MGNHMKPQGHQEGTGYRGGVAAWSFVYGFFSNGVPFDAPNRSEPCTSF